jgi:cadmium resistance transport/sequestration family protein
MQQSEYDLGLALLLIKLDVLYIPVFKFPSMSWFFTALATGITSFAATNIDDIVILMLFFSQVSDTFRPRHIITGQYLGFTVLIIASLPGLFGGLIVPKAIIGLLGLLPIAIGIKHLLNREEEASTVQSVSSESSRSLSNSSKAALLVSFLNPQIYKVAAVTVANGGDNIGIYVPLFASNNLVSLGVILSVFYLLIGVWCLIAYLLSRQPTMAKLLTRYGSALAPFVLIGLGVFILIESGTYRLLPPFK